MKPSAPIRHPVSHARLAGSWLVAALLVACGGGGGDGGTPATSTTSTYAAGTVTGLGSVIVNGVRYDDSSASVTGEDDSAGHASDVKVGMQVEVESGPVSCSTDSSGSTTCTARATHVGYGWSALLGPIDAGSLVAGTSFQLLGQTVLIGSNTTIEFQSAAQTALAAGMIVEVHGVYDKATGETSATRIEVKAADLAAFYSGTGDTDRYRLRGALALFDATARTATIGGQPVHFASGLDLSSLADGQILRVRIVPAASASTATPWEVDRVKPGERHLGEHRGSHAELEGTITDFSAAADGLSVSFKIDGNDVQVVLASVRFDDGITAADLADGARVEVEGQVDATSGALIASKIELKKRKGGTEKVESTELHGVTSNYDATARTFTLRGETVLINADTVFRSPLVEADLAAAAGVQVEVKGVHSADGTTIVATLIKRDNN